MPFPLTPSQLQAYNNLPAIPPGQPLGNLLNELNANAAPKPFASIGVDGTEGGAPTIAIPQFTTVPITNVFGRLITRGGFSIGANNVITYNGDPIDVRVFVRTTTQRLATGSQVISTSLFRNGSFYTADNTNFLGVNSIGSAAFETVVVGLADNDTLQPMLSSTFGPGSDSVQVFALSFMVMGI